MFVFPPVPPAPTTTACVPAVTEAGLSAEAPPPEVSPETEQRYPPAPPPPAQCWPPPPPPAMIKYSQDKDGI